MMDSDDGEPESPDDVIAELSTSGAASPAGGRGPQPAEAAGSGGHKPVVHPVVSRRASIAIMDDLEALMESSDDEEAVEKVKFTGLTQDSQLDPAAVGLKIPIRPLELTQILGQPCEFQVERAPSARESAGVSTLNESDEPEAPESSALLSVRSWDQVAVQAWLRSSAFQFGPRRFKQLAAAFAEHEAGMLTQGGQGGRPVPLASRFQRIPTHFPSDLHGI